MSQQRPEIITINEIKKTDKHIGIALVIFSLVSILFVYGMPVILAMFDINLFNLDNVFLTMAAFGISLLILLFLFATVAKQEKVPFLKLNKKVNISFSEIIQLSVLAIAFQVFATTFISLFFTIFNIKQANIEFLGNFTSSIQIARNCIYFVSIIIIQTIADEFIFRGVLLKSLSKYGVYFAYISSAILYAFSKSNVIGVLSAFILGLFYGKIALMYNSIRPTIFISLSSSIVFYLVAILGRMGIQIFGLFVVLIYLIACIILFVHRDKGIIINKSGNDKKLLITIFKSPYIVIYVLLFVVQLVLSYM